RARIGSCVPVTIMPTRVNNRSKPLTTWSSASTTSISCPAATGGLDTVSGQGYPVSPSPVYLIGGRSLAPLARRPPRPRSLRAGEATLRSLYFIGGRSLAPLARRPPRPRSLRAGEATLRSPMIAMVDGDGLIVRSGAGDGATARRL